MTQVLSAFTEKFIRIKNRVIFIYLFWWIPYSLVSLVILAHKISSLIGKKPLKSIWHHFNIYCYGYCTCLFQELRRSELVLSYRDMVCHIYAVIFQTWTIYIFLLANKCNEYTLWHVFNWVSCLLFWKLVVDAIFNDLQIFVRWRGKAPTPVCTDNDIQNSSAS